MHRYVRCCLFLGEKSSKDKYCKNNNIKSLELNTLYKPMPLSWYDCNKKPKTKPWDEKRNNHIFYACLASLSDEKQKNKETESIFNCGCIILITLFLRLP